MFQTVLGGIAAAITLIGFVPYFRDILRGKTKPHAFSWFVWTLLTGIAFVAQLIEQGGAGAWVTGASSLACFGIFVLSLKYGKRDFPTFDWLCLTSALFALFLWWLTNDPLLAVILVTITDALAFIPTFRKGYHHPKQETMATYALNGLSFFLGLFALETLTVATWLYPASVVLTNWSFTALLFIRRRRDA